MLIVEAFILLLYDKHASRKSIFLGDIFRPDYFHVLPALIRRFREVKESGAKSVSCRRAGSPWREFLHVDDPGVACVFSLER